MHDVNGDGNIRGYLVSGRKRPFVAVYIPEFHHIWTNPACSKHEVKQALQEEFIHATETFLHPSEILPLLNYLAGKDNLPRHNEFRDVIEALYFAAYPLTNKEPIDLRHPPPLHSPFKALGMRILETALQFASHENIGSSQERADHQALWVLKAVLLNIVPLKPDHGNSIVDCIQKYSPEKNWQTSHELYEGLIAYLAQQIKTQHSETLGFTLRRPNDPHELLVKAIEVVNEFLITPVEKLTATSPVLLSLLTLGIYRKVRLVWLKKKHGIIIADIDTWDFTENNMRSSTTAFARYRINLNQPEPHNKECSALYYYLNCFAFIKELLQRKGQFSEPYLLHEMLELTPYMLKRIIDPGEGIHRCLLCRSALSDEKFLQGAAKLRDLTTPDKMRLLKSASDYNAWLKQGCLKEISERITSVQNSTHIQPAINERLNIKPRTPISSSYNYPLGKKKFLAKFVPALGQIWIMPECPDSMLVQIQSHELYHRDTTSLQPSQLMHLRFTLLDRRMPEPLRFNDVMEASYLLGLTLQAGFPPDPKYFPPAKHNIQQLAESLAFKARTLSVSAKGFNDDKEAEREAARAVLFLLHHVIPARAGLGEQIVAEIGNLTGPRKWRTCWDLWPHLQYELEKKIKKEHLESLFTLGLPPDAHRLVGEALIFLNQVMLPIPERKSAFISTLPSLIHIFSFGGVIVVPIIRLKDKGRYYNGEINIIGPDDGSATIMTNAIKTQSAILDDLASKNIHCECTQCFIDIVKATEPHWREHKRLGLADYLRNIIPLLNPNRFISNEYTCMLCRNTLKDNTVRNALESLKYIFQEQQERLLEAAQQYEDWLLSDCMELVREITRLDKPIHPIKRYKDI